MYSDEYTDERYYFGLYFQEYDWEELFEIIEERGDYLWDILFEMFT